MSDFVIDPVCGRKIYKNKLEIFDQKAGDYVEFKQKQTAFDRFTGVEHGEIYYFCSEGCKERFEKNPQLYMKKSRAVRGSA
jgi:YHS domain-containing protein